MDITKDAQQAQHEFGPGRLAGEDAAATARAHGTEAGIWPRRQELIRNAKKPGHPRRPGHHPQRRASQRSRQFAERINAPVAMTLLGLGRLPGQPPAEHRR